MRLTRVAAPILGLGIILAACSSGTSATPSPAAPSAAASGAPAASTAVLALATSALGQIVVDGNGMTLYVFTPDNGGAPTCYDACAGSWPALLTNGAPTVGTGLTAGDFATATRTDGGTQVTFHGWPLYHFAADSAAGDTKGEGVAGKWFVVGADGKMIQAGASPAASAAASPAASAAASPAASAAAGVTVNLVKGALGTFLVDGTGRTLYAFTADSAGKPSCTGSCSDNWPALTADAVPTLGTGLDAEDFTLVARDDGTKQIAFYGAPLYFFAGDSAAGQTNGQGVGSKWYVVDGEGKMIK